MGSRSAARHLAIAGLALGLSTTGCGKSSKNSSESPASAGAAGNEPIESGLGGAGGAGGADPCSAEAALPSKRIIRLSMRQVLRSLATLLGPDVADQAASALDVSDPDVRDLAPLADPAEGVAYNPINLAQLDHLTRIAGEYTSAHFGELTGCTSGDAACAEGFLLQFAERAFRRPLASDEQARLSATYAELRALSPTVTAERALEHGIAAVLHSPSFLYRTELGEQPNQEGRLAPHEVASLVSYFVGGGPPDAELLDAAAADRLATPEDIAAQVKRLLETDAARSGLESLLLGAFRYQNLRNVVIDDPAFNAELRNALYESGRLFLRKTLWGPTVDDLLLSRTGYVNATLAPIFGVDSDLDASQFARVELPAERVGLLTQPALLAARARPDGPSVAARGLAVRDWFVCGPPLLSPDTVPEAPPLPADATPRQVAEARAATPACNECHEAFDAYGVALERFDALGRYREKYADGRSIDVAVTLPRELGGGQATDITDVAKRLTEGGYWSRCITHKLFSAALTDGVGAGPSADSCSVRRALASIQQAPPSFADVVQAVAESPEFASRAAPKL